MADTDLKSYCTKDNYLEITYRRYESFKETSDYHEGYKEPILSELNRAFQQDPIIEENVVDKARKIQKENPSSGSFVHWSNTADLVKYAEARPHEAVELWDLYRLGNELSVFANMLYEFDEKVNHELTKIHSIIQNFDKNQILIKTG